MITTKTKKSKPIHACVYGPPGIGKTTFAVSADKAVVLATEDRLGHLDAEQFPQVTSWEQALAHVRSYVSEEHDFKTLVIDSVNNLERLLFAKIANENRAKTIADIPYGRGYSIAAEEWKSLISLCENALFKGNVIYTAHCKISEFNDPTGQPYSRYELDLHKRTSGILSASVDFLLFAGYKYQANDGKATTRGQRVLYTAWSPAREAKFSGHAPSQIALDWKEFIRYAQPSIEQHRADVRSLLDSLNESETKQKLLSAFQRADSKNKLAWLEQAALVEKEKQE